MPNLEENYCVWPAIGYLLFAHDRVKCNWLVRMVHWPASVIPCLVLKGLYRYSSKIPTFMDVLKMAYFS